jgi:hypothetical protein
MAKKKQVVAVKLKGDDKGTKVGTEFLPGMNPFRPNITGTKAAVPCPRCNLLHG